MNTNLLQFALMSADRGNYGNDYNDDNGDYYRKRERNTRDDDRYGSRRWERNKDPVEQKFMISFCRDRDRRRSRSRSRDGYNDVNDEDSWGSSNR